MAPRSGMPHSFWIGQDKGDSHLIQDAISLLGHSRMGCATSVSVHFKVEESTHHGMHNFPFGSLQNRREWAPFTSPRQHGMHNIPIGSLRNRRGHQARDAQLPFWFTSKYKRASSMGCPPFWLDALLVLRISPIIFPLRGGWHPAPPARNFHFLVKN